MSDPENEKQVIKRGSKHMRLRYYSSYEEATIVKLWREHFTQITSYTENLQIFREISSGLHQHQIRLNKQEVRRRISSYRNKYLIEKSRTDNDSLYKSPWRLYGLIDNLFQENLTSPTTKTEQQLIEEIECKIRNELPSLPRFSRNNCRTLNFQQDANACPFLDSQQSIKLEMLHESPAAAVSQQPMPIKTETKDYENENENENENDEEMSEKRPPLAPANRILEQLLSTHDTAVSSQPGSSARRIRRRSFLPRAGQITLAHIEALRKENDLLAEQRDNYQRRLDLKKLQYEQLEQTFDCWLFQMDEWISRLTSNSLTKNIATS